MAELGHDVVGIDVDPLKIDSLARGEAPFFEPGLPELLGNGLDSGRLAFSSTMAAARGAAVHFIAVGTPQRPDGSVDLGYVHGAVDALVPMLTPGDVVVGKSTVPVGTFAELVERIEDAGATLIWNPEFLREGHAVRDTLAPDRLVYGVRTGDSRSVDILDAVYTTLLEAGVARMVTDPATAELVKVAANAFLATKISFINAMADIADAAGADVGQLADAIGQDPRIGRRFLNAGLGFGGGCLPKDIRGFIARAEELGVGASFRFLREVDAVNLARRDRLVDLTRAALGGDLAGRRIAVLGLAFKPGPDDVRDSPALEVATRLRAEGAHVLATDPQAVETSRRLVPELDYRTNIAETVIDADAVLVLTEWPEFVSIDPDVLGRVVGRVLGEQIVIDGRNCLDPEAWRDAGWSYFALGRVSDPLPATETLQRTRRPTTDEASVRAAVSPVPGILARAR